MKNIYLRLFVAQTKLMTAEKMKLDRFCERDEYLAYRIALPPMSPPFESRTSDDVDFMFEVEVENKQYHFTRENIADIDFTVFELHLSEFLNVLFARKQEFDRHNGMLKDVMKKIGSQLSEDERHCLATNIDANTTTVLKALGVKTSE